jgi:UDP-N-acetylmuramate--alanine ligase
MAVVFQPHLYSRTRKMAAEFAAALAQADQAVVLPIYPARETPIPGVTSSLVVEASGGVVGQLIPSDLPGWVDGLDSDAVVLFMGAGDVTLLAHAVAEGTEANGVGV